MSVTADLASLKRMLGSTTTRDDDLLGWALDATSSYVADRVYPGDWARDDVQETVLLVAARLYKRRQTPEGAGGWAEEGVTRVLGGPKRAFIVELDRDPDIAALLEQREDMTRTGFA